MNITGKVLDLITNARFVDMTQDLKDGIPYWPTQPKFEAETIDHQSKGDESYWRRITFCEHSGTHIDALSHFFEGAQNVDEIPLTKIIGRAVNIDAVKTAPRGLVTVEDIKAFEEKNGAIQKDDIVFFHFGWDEKWNDTQAFLKDWPGLSEQAAKYLLDKGVKAVGCDTLALDAAGSENEAHKVLLGNGIYIIENVNKLGELPPFFAVIGLPCKFKGGSGATMRLIALLDK